MPTALIICLTGWSKSKMRWMDGKKSEQINRRLNRQTNKCEEEQRDKDNISGKFFFYTTHLQIS